MLPLGALRLAYYNHPGASECLLVDVDEGGAVLLNYDADEFLFNNKYVHPEGLADDPVFANCNIMLERKQ